MEQKKKLYEVINLDSDKSHGMYETLVEAHGCVLYDELRTYQIWYDDVCVKNCDAQDREENSK